MNDNPMNDAFDAAEDEAEVEQETRDGTGTIDLDDYYEVINDDDAPKEKTIGIAVTEEMHAFYHELQDSDEMDIDVVQSMRNHLENLADRHDAVFEKAMRKLEIDREVSS